MDVRERLSNMSDEQIQALDEKIDHRLGALGVRAFSSASLKESHLSRIRNEDAALMIARLSERQRSVPEDERSNVEMEVI